jgi:ribosomal protein L11 methyltransferase
MNSPEHWHLLSVLVPRADIEIVADYLWSRGVVAIEEIDHMEGTSGDVIELRTSYGDEIDQLSQDVSLAFPHVRLETVIEERSIADTWRPFAQPVSIDETLRLVPSWQKQNVSEVPGVVDIAIDPEDVFGLGNHPTTIGALRLARKHVDHESTVFDYGCGSGVLGIALARTRACVVSAYDIADNAREVISRNAHLNDVQVSWVSSPINVPQTFDVVLANILAPVLREIASNINTMTRVGSLVVLSGMRAEQWASVQESYSWCDEVDTLTIDGWITVVLRGAN